MKYLIMGMLLTLSLPVEAGWERYAANTLIVADWAQTRDISNHSNIREKNKFLGYHPSDAEVNRYFAVYLLQVNVMGEMVVPEKHKRVWYGAWALYQLSVVAHNQRIGVNFKF